MKTKSFSFLTVASIILASGAANANLLFDIYAGGTYGIGGYSLFADGEHESFSSQSYGAVLGMDIPVLRLELEYNYINGDEVAMNAGFINAYLKMPTPIVKPYIGAGIGSTFSSKYEPENAPHIDIDNTTVYQGMLGLTFDLPAIPFNIDVEGRVLYAPDMFEIAELKPDFLQYEGRVKLRYVF